MGAVAGECDRIQHGRRRREHGARRKCRDWRYAKRRDESKFQQQTCDFRQWPNYPVKLAGGRLRMASLREGAGRATRRSRRDDGRSTEEMGG